MSDALSAEPRCRGQPIDPNAVSFISRSGLEHHDVQHSVVFRHFHRLGLARASPATSQALGPLDEGSTGLLLQLQVDH